MSRHRRARTPPPSPFAGPDGDRPPNSSSTAAVAACHRGRKNSSRKKSGTSLRRIRICCWAILRVAAPLPWRPVATMAERTSSDHTDLPLDVLDRIDRICDRFEAAWDRGERPRIEDDLGEVVEPHRRALLRDLLAAEVAARRRRGERPEPRDYRDRFPDDADAVEAAFCRPREAPGLGDAASPAHASLLVGLLGFQTGLIDQSTLVEVLRDWTADKARPLAEVLAAQGRPRRTAPHPPGGTGRRVPQTARRRRCPQPRFPPRGHQHPRTARRARRPRDRCHLDPGRRRPHRARFRRVPPRRRVFRQLRRRRPAVPCPAAARQGRSGRRLRRRRHRAAP